jgi:hypothetical protein
VPFKLLVFECAYGCRNPVSKAIYRYDQGLLERGGKRRGGRMRSMVLYHMELEVREAHVLELPCNKVSAQSCAEWDYAYACHRIFQVVSEILELGLGYFPSPEKVIIFLHAHRHYPFQGLCKLRSAKGDMLYVARLYALIPKRGLYRMARELHLKFSLGETLLVCSVYDFVVFYKGCARVVAIPDSKNIHRINRNM